MTASVPLRILVIEDEPADYLLLERYLSKQGIVAECLRVDSDSALREALERDWDLLLSDYNMPGMDFGVILKCVRQRYPELPVILVSGGVGEETAVDLLHLGLTDFILKGHLARLPSAIQRALDAVAERRARQAAEVALRANQAAALEEQHRARMAALNLMEDAQVARQRAEETAASLRKLSLAVEQSPESIVITNTKGQIEYVNDSFLRTTGYCREEVLGQNPRILNRGKTPRKTYEALWATLNQGKVWKGEFHNTRKDGTDYVELATIAPIKQADGSITHYVAIKEDITERKLSEELIHRLAYFDLLTDLPNRSLLLDRLKQAMSSGRRSKQFGMLLLLDVDHFKILNDTQGYEAGDQLLQEIARRLRDCIRAEDTAARIGGDEFVVIAENLGQEEAAAVAQAELIAEKIHRVLSRTYALRSGGQHHYCTPSIGITAFRGDESTGEELLKQAEVALYKAKGDGRNLVRFFSPAIQQVLDARALMESGMRAAIERREFHLYYQPQLDHEGRVLGAEALIRWIGSDGKLVSPAEFIPLAEETGLIVSIGNWVVDTACAQLAAWQQHPETRHLVLAINVSAKQFHRPDFVQEVRARVARSGIDPAKLKLELTESVILNEVESTILRMGEIRALGVRFALDDFGTGYSSLSYLRRLPFDQLKIDQSFVRDMVDDNTSSSIVCAILAMSQALGLEVVAEGVETRAQLDFLQLHGCESYQGYLFGRPVPITEWNRLWCAGSTARSVG